MKSRKLVSLGLGLALGSGMLLRAVAAPVIVPAQTGPNLTLNWPSSPGTLYQVQACSDLVLGSWQALTSTVPVATLSAWADPMPVFGTRFYRLLAPEGETAAFEPPERAPAEPCDCGSCSAAPRGPPFLYLHSGEVVYSAADLHIRGRGLDFIWARKYRSRVGPNTAQGNGWDFSYNIRIEPFGGHLLLYDGNTRQDLYLHQPDGSFAADQFFREGRFDSNGVFTLLFPDTARWEFLPFNGTAAQGKISRIADRNGNALTFTYDTAGRLVNVRDTLDRDIVIAYNSSGLISTINDFAGRQVKYAYYQAADAGGSPGDLKSVTTPAVTGTPNGNDFPSGKTTIYTYSKGLSVESLNHNLLTVTDPKGQTWLQNLYATTLNPADLNFDRVTRQTWGQTSEVLMLHYVRQTPSAANNYAVLKTILNDRVGNVSEWLYDAGNRCVIHRAYTGRAVPGVTTTETANRPTSPLRPTDPPLFETRYEWNVDSLLTRVVYPSGNTSSNLYELALDPAAARRSRGNLRSRIRLPGPLGGDQPQLVESFEYDTSFGGCCGFNFVTKHTDARSNATHHAYDAHGNRTNTIHRMAGITESWEYNSFGQHTAHVHPDNGSGHRRRDEFTYYASGTPRGFRYQAIIDAASLGPTTTYEYDAMGNLVRIIDARGHDWLYTYNQLDQKVRERSAPVSDGSVRFVTDRYYDANDNLIRLDLPNTGDLCATTANTNLTTVYDYDILNRRTRMTQEVDATHNAVTEYGYDANRNLTLVRFGEATSGRQPANIVQGQHDERDKPFRTIRAPGTADQSTDRFDYDANGKVTRVSKGVESGAQTTMFAYDGYNRLTTTTDPMGNVRRCQYDANANVISEKVEGELTDLPGSGANVRLSETAYFYDWEDRCTRTESSFFDPLTQLPLDDGQATTHFLYSTTAMLLTTVVDDRGNATMTAYDTANRPRRRTDAKGNTFDYTYDAHDNLVTLTEVHKSDLGYPNQTNVTRYAYDNLDRRVETVDSANNTNRFAYDSRDNLAKSFDALGNQKCYEYDGLDRLLRVVRNLTTTGTGSGVITSTVVTVQSWDDSSRLTSQTDGGSNTTRYVYDALNRLVRTAHADNTTNQAVYDAHGSPVATTNANGTIVAFAYDLLDRCTNKAITPGPGVAIDTTFERFQYDGLSRLIRAEDNDSVVARSYDSLSHRVSESLNGKSLAWTWDGVGNKRRNTYPGGRMVNRLYDALNRVYGVSDASVLVGLYSYMGPRRVERRELGNNMIRTAYEYDGLSGVPNAAGDFGAQRLVRATHTRISDGLVLDDHGFAWDADQNRIARRDRRTGGAMWTHRFAYDSMRRLRQTVVTNSVGAVLRDTFYNLDGADNRATVTGSPDPGGYTLSATLPEPADRQMNQYTATPFDSRSYDRSGNVTNIMILPSDIRRVAYDYRHQMVRYTNVTANAIHSYAYDALGRRIQRIVQSGTSFQTTRYFYDGGQIVEEQDQTGATLATCVYGRGSEEVLNLQRGTTNYYFQADDLGNVFAVSDASGLVVERYEYGDYGPPLFFDAAGGSLAQSAIANPLLFAGLRYDPETGLYHCRARYLDPRAGRFLTRDPLGMWSDGASRGNACAYAGNNPQTWTDPTGTRIRLQGDRRNGGDGDGGGGGGGGESYPTRSREPDCYGRTLNLEFDDCSSGDSDVVEESSCRAYRAVRQASADLSDLVAHDEDNADRTADAAGEDGPSPSVGATRARVARWFGGPDGSTSLRSKRVIRDKLKDIRNGFRDDTVGFECESGSDCGDEYAYVPWPYTFWVDIHLCPRFFDRSRNGRAAGVAHEMAHEYGGALYTPEQYFSRSDADRDHGYETDVLRENADSYATFLWDFYIPVPASGTWE